MNLLSAKDLQDINGAMTDIFDTFFKDEIKVSKKGQVFSRFSNFDKGKKDDTTVRCLVVWGSGKDSNALQSDVTGTVDESDGYILLSYLDADYSGLTDNNRVQTINSGEDKIIINGVEMKTTAIYPKANLAGDFVLLQVYFKKELCQSGK